MHNYYVIAFASVGVAALNLNNRLIRTPYAYESTVDRVMRPIFFVCIFSILFSDGTNGICSDSFFSSSLSCSLPSSSLPSRRLHSMALNTF